VRCSARPWTHRRLLIGGFHLRGRLRRTQRFVTGYTGSAFRFVIAPDFTGTSLVPFHFDHRSRPSAPFNDSFAPADLSAAHDGCSHFATGVTV
jgi:hypothetical protein